jgi:hypothetical protein
MVFLNTYISINVYFNVVDQLTKNERDPDPEPGAVVLLYLRALWMDLLCSSRLRNDYVTYTYVIILVLSPAMTSASFYSLMMLQLDFSFSLGQKNTFANIYFPFILDRFFRWIL